MIRKLRSGEYRLYSRRPDPRTGRRRNLGTFRTRAQAVQHEREIEFFRRNTFAARRNAHVQPDPRPRLTSPRDGPRRPSPCTRGSPRAGHGRRW